MDRRTFLGTIPLSAAALNLSQAGHEIRRLNRESSSWPVLPPGVPYFTRQKMDLKCRSVPQSPTAATSFGTFLSTPCYEFCHHLAFHRFGFRDSRLAPRRAYELITCYISGANSFIVRGFLYFKGRALVSQRAFTRGQGHRTSWYSQSLPRIRQRF